MSDEADKWLAIFEQYRPLFAKAMAGTLLAAEEAELKAALKQLKALEPYLSSRLTVVDPREEAARQAAEVYEMHYRRKAELNRKLYGAP